MSSSPCDTAAPSCSLPMSPAAGSVCLLPLGQLRTTYAALRPGRPQRFPDQSPQMPIRVAPTEEGTYEVIDGFKRLADRRQSGEPLIPVVIEPPASTAEHKRLLLRANAPPRTLTALDEARVVCSLMSEEGLSAGAIARLLDRKVNWVARRVAIGTHLSPGAEEKLARGAIGPTVAHALCALAEKDQDALLEAVERHGLTLRETLALLWAYRVADEPDRRRLLKEPLGLLRARLSPDPVSSPTAAALEERLSAHPPGPAEPGGLCHSRRARPG